MFSCPLLLPSGVHGTSFEWTTHVITFQMGTDRVITLKFMTGEKITVPVRDGMTVLDLKRAASNHWGYEDPLIIRLIVAGRPLEDHEAVSELNIDPDDVVFVTLHLQG